MTTRTSTLLEKRSRNFLQKESSSARSSLSSVNCGTQITGKNMSSRICSTLLPIWRSSMSTLLSSTGHRLFQATENTAWNDLVNSESSFEFEIDFKDGCRLAHESEKTMFPVDNNGYFCSDKESHYVETWEVMEELVDEGLTKSIGLSNFNRRQVQNHQFAPPKNLFLDWRNSKRDKEAFPLRFAKREPSLLTRVGLA